MRVPPKGSPDDWFDWLVGNNSRKSERATLIIGGLDPSDDVPVEPFVQRLSDPDDDVVFWALVGLLGLGVRAHVATAKIAALATHHRVVGVRQMAIRVLSVAAASNQLATSTIERCLADESSLVRRGALEALIKLPIHTAELLDRIASMADDDDEAVASWSEIALRNIRMRNAGGRGAG